MVELSLNALSKFGATERSHPIAYSYWFLQLRRFSLILSTLLAHNSKNPGRFEIGVSLQFVVENSKSLHKGEFQLLLAKTLKFLRSRISLILVGFESSTFALLIAKFLYQLVYLHLSLILTDLLKSLERDLSHL